MLRAFLSLQIGWIIIAGLVFRNLIPFPDNRASDLFFIAALYVFPACVAYATMQTDLTTTRKYGVAIVEVGLTVAYIIAVIPGVQ